MVRRGGVVHLLDFVFFPGCVIPTDNGKFDPNRLFPWMTWERFAKGRTLVGVDEDDNDFASAGLELGEKKHQLTIDELASHTHKALTYTFYTPQGGSKPVPLVGSLYANSYDIAHNTGGDQPHNNIQPSTTVYYWRRVS